MAHSCPTAYGWYFGKFLLGLTGMLILCQTILKEKRPRCLCPARERDMQRRKSRVLCCCPAADPLDASVQKERPPDRAPSTLVNAESLSPEMQVALTSKTLSQGTAVVPVIQHPEPCLQPPEPCRQQLSDLVGQSLKSLLSTTEKMAKASLAKLSFKSLRSSASPVPRSRRKCRPRNAKKCPSRGRTNAVSNAQTQCETHADIQYLDIEEMQAEFERTLQELGKLQLSLVGTAVVIPAAKHGRGRCSPRKFTGVQMEQKISCSYRKDKPTHRGGSFNFQQQVKTSFTDHTEIIPGMECLDECSHQYSLSKNYKFSDEEVYGAPPDTEECDSYRGFGPAVNEGCGPLSSQNSISTCPSC